MGTKRVGLARMEALMENLQRDLAMGGGTFSGTYLAMKSAPASTTTTLTAADSGKTILMAPNAAIVTLPSPVVGLHFRVVQIAAYSTAICKVVTPTTDGTVFFVGHSVSADSNDGNDSNNSSNDIIKFGSDTLAGDYIDVFCISTTQWVAIGSAQTGTSNSITFADS
jgi:hypothetical protein